MPTRRKFLLSCSTVAAGASVFPRSVLANAGLREVALDEISFFAFSRQTQTQFLAYGEPHGAVGLRLLEAKLYGPMPIASAQAEDATNEKFSLLFMGPIHQPLAQGTRVFEQGGLGRFEMFIAPVGRADPRWLYYEAAFNRPGPAADSGHGRFSQ